jgi:hypothetical protein
LNRFGRRTVKRRLGTGIGSRLGLLDGRLQHKPGSDEINMDFFPGVHVMVSLDREVSILLTLFLVMLTGCTKLDMALDVGGERAPVEVLVDHLGGASFAWVSEHGVVPINDFGLESLWGDNTILKMDDRSAAGDLGVVLRVGLGKGTELGISLLMGAMTSKAKGKVESLSSLSLTNNSSKRLISLGGVLANGW